MPLVIELHANADRMLVFLLLKKFHLWHSDPTCGGKIMIETVTNFIGDYHLVFLTFVVLVVWNAFSIDKIGKRTKRIEKHLGIDNKKG